MRFVYRLCRLAPVKILLNFGFIVGCLSFNSKTEAKSDVMIVRKAKGKNAIVQFKTLAPKKGEKFSVSPAKAKGEDGEESSGDEGDADSGGGGSRANTIALATNISVQGGFAMNVSSQFGWNSGGFEIGPVLNLSVTSGTFGLLGGVFADINFAENKAPASTIIALGLKATFDLGSKAFAITGGLPFKLFVLGNSTTAIRISPDVIMTFPGASISFGLNGGLQVYF